MFCCCYSPFAPAALLKPLPPIRLLQLNVAHPEMFSIRWNRAVAEVLGSFPSTPPLCFRNQSPRRHLSVRLPRAKTGQRVLGGRLWWRSSANIFSLVGVMPPTFSFGCNHGSALTVLVLLYWSEGRRIHLSVVFSWQLPENMAPLLCCTDHASNMAEKCGPVLHFIEIIGISERPVKSSFQFRECKRCSQNM